MILYGLEFLVVLFAATVKGVLGFGLPLIAIPLMTSIFGARPTVIVFTILNLVANAILVYRLRRQPRERWLAWTLLAVLVGAAIGAHMVTVVPEGLLALTVGLLTLLTLAMQRLLPKGSLSAAQTRVAGPIAGLAGGVLGGMTDIYSPFLAAFLQLAGVESDRFVFMLTLLFMGGLSVQVVTFATAGMYTVQPLLLILVGLPPLFLGVSLGNRLRSRLNPVLFRRVITTLLVLTSLNLIRVGLGL